MSNGGKAAFLLTSPRKRSGPIHQLQFSILHLQSQSSKSGGIAQLVERQLCKLDVRGSNPLASISKEMEAEMRTDGSTGGAAQPQGFEAKLTCQSQRAALDNPLASISSKERRSPVRRPETMAVCKPPLLDLFVRVAHASRVLAKPSRVRELFGKTVSARRRNQHARRVRYPEPDPRIAPQGAAVSSPPT